MVSQINMSLVWSRVMLNNIELVPVYSPTWLLTANVDFNSFGACDAYVLGKQTTVYSCADYC